jgi:hypothetical protein
VYFTVPSVNVSPIDKEKVESQMQSNKTTQNYKKYYHLDCPSTYLMHNQHQKQQQFGQHVLLEYPMLNENNKNKTATLLASCTQPHTHR